jgi:arsenate reductase
MKTYNLDVDQYFNTHGKSYRTLQLQDRKDTLSVDSKLSLLSRDGMLIKRPLLLMDNHLLIGFKVNVWEDTLKTR